MKRFKKITAATLATVMAVVGSTQLFADDTSLTTTFGVYSPTLHISVPVNAAVQVNPLYDNTANTVKGFTVASEELKIFNASVDLEKDEAIPCVATVKATITPKASADVQTKYNAFTPSETSTKKVINLNLASTTATAAINDEVAGITAAYEGSEDDEKLVKFTSTVSAKDYSTYKTAADGNFKTATNKAAITAWGSKISFAVPKATTTDTTAGKTFSSDATKITPGAASFAVIGNANSGAEWASDDVAVAISYNIKAAAATAVLNQTAISTAPTWTNSSSATDLTIVIPDVGESKVTAIAAHNDDTDIADVYGNYFFEAKSDTVANGYTVTYAPNATTTTQTDATIKIPKDYVSLSFLAGGSDPDNSPYQGKAQDFVIALSDGRFVVTTLTCNKAS